MELETHFSSDFQLNFLKVFEGLLQLGKIVGLIGYCHGLVIALSFVMLCLCLQLDDFKGLVLRLLSIPT